MDRLACIELPQLPLQIALNQFPEAAKTPLAVVREDRPTSPMLFLNQAARDEGLQTGMRYSEGLSLVAHLHGTTVSAHELEAARALITGELSRWSPTLEACPFDPGAFWVGASGLSGLYGTEAQWGAGVRSALKALGFQAHVVVGGTRVGTWLIARSRSRSTIVKTAQAEERALDAAPLSLIPLTIRSRRVLAKLGITTLGQLTRIPADELARRLGPDLAHELRDLQVLSNLPLQGRPAEGPERLLLTLGHAESGRERLLPRLAELLQTALEPVRRHGRLLASLQWTFHLEAAVGASQGTLLTEVLRPAVPTTDFKALLKLVELRLSQMTFALGVVRLELTIIDAAEPTSSGELFDAPQARDPRLGAQALALIRAQWGNDAVVRPVLVDSHVPEQAFAWAPLEALTPPDPSAPRAAATLPTRQPAVRRVFRQPQLRAAPGTRLAGPFLLQVSPTGLTPSIDREQWFLRNPRREVQWVSLDRLTGQTQLSGVVD